MTREQWESWQAHPTTQVVFQASLSMAEALKAEWMSASWEAGKSDPILLAELRTRSDAYRAISETTYEDWCAAAGVEPEPA